MVSANMYFAKLSMNSEIYDFYENPELFADYIKKVYRSINSETQIKDKNGNTYKFNSLIYNKDKLAITGRYSKIFDGNVESYDWKNDQPRKVGAKDLSSTVNFYFDLNTQLIAYTGARDFGYRQFTEMFKAYIENALNDNKIKVAVELLINDAEMNEKIKRFKMIEQISFSIIPPNPPNLEEFNALFGVKAEVISESRTTRYKEVYSSIKKGLKYTKYFINTIFAIKDGYGSVSVKGINENERVEVITSQEAAPKKININRKNKDNLEYIKNEGEQGIQSIMVEKTRKDLEGRKQY